VLRSLRMSVEVDMEGLFSHLTMPPLTQLRLETWSEVIRGWPESVLLSFLTHAGSLLQCFALKVGSMSEDLLINHITSVGTCSSKRFFNTQRVENIAIGKD
jgi:hypothetical protein